MFIIKYKKIFVSISATLVLLSLVSIFILGLNPGIDFKGGALTEVNYTKERPAQASLNKPLEDLNFGSILLQPTGETGYIIKSRSLDDSDHTALLSTLSFNNANPLTETSFDSIGPSVGHELTRKAIVAVI